MSDTRVLMIETPIYSHFVKNAIRRAICGVEIIDIVDQAQNALDLVRTLQPDILIVDLRNRSNALLNTLKTIGFENPKTLIVGRTKDPEIDFILEAVSAGVIGFINDQTSCDELLNAIHTIREGYPYYPQNVVHRVVKNLQSKFAVVN